MSIRRQEFFFRSCSLGYTPLYDTLIVFIKIIHISQLFVNESQRRVLYELTPANLENLEKSKKPENTENL